MARTPILLLACFCLALISPTIIKGQTILTQTVFHDIHYGFPSYKWVNVDDSGNYIIGIEKTRTDTEGLFKDDTFIPAFRHFSDQSDLGLVDLFLCKLDPQFNLINSLVIDNCEIDRDLAYGEHYTLFSMNLIDSNEDKDSFPILINGTVEIPRDGNRGRGVLIVMDSNLVLKQFFFPSTGEIGQVAVDGHIAYLELRIPNNEPYIIVNNADTVHNHHRFGDPNDFGRQTVVLCKYNLLLSEVEWTIRIGNVGYEELREMLIDHNHNLIILGESSSHFFSFHDSDTVINNSDHSPFVAKYGADGNFLAGFINPNEENAYARTLVLDSDDNMYIVGLYYGNDYVIEDTILIRPGLGRPNADQSIITKLHSDGSFAWISQASGDFERTGFYDVAEFNGEQLVLCGDFNEGQINFNGQTYNDDPTADKKFGYLLWVNKQTGSIDNHFMTSGDYRREFYDIEADHKGNVDLFMRYRGIDTIFGSLFETPLEERNGYLLKLGFSPVSNENFKNENISLSIKPNPITDQGFTISIANPTIVENLTFVILDAMGHLIYKSGVSSNESAFITTANWLTGPYWIQVTSANHLQTHLLIRY